MGEGFKWVLVVYKKYRLIKRIIVVIVGVVVGIIGCIMFVKVFYNYNVVVWVGLLVVFVIVFLCLNFFVCCDYERVIIREIFKVYLLIGVFGVVVGFVVLIIYIVLGVIYYEKGNYVVWWCMFCCRILYILLID